MSTTTGLLTLKSSIENARKTYESAVAAYERAAAYSAAEDLHNARYDLAEAECLYDIRAGARVLHDVDVAGISDEDLINDDDFRDVREKYLRGDDPLDVDFEQL